jgi:CRP-like cAMP-binding protein
MIQNSALLKEISNMLTECRLFSHLPYSDIEAVSAHFGILEVGQDEVIFNEGDEGTFMCIVYSGRVSIIKTDQNGRAVVMSSEGEGHTLGEMAVLDGERRSASCVAESDCVLVTLSRQAMDNMLETQSRIGAKILRAIAVSLSRRMRMTAGKLVDFQM